MSPSLGRCQNHYAAKNDLEFVTLLPLLVLELLVPHRIHFYVVLGIEPRQVLG